MEWDTWFSDKPKISQIYCFSFSHPEQLFVFLLCSTNYVCGCCFFYQKHVTFHRPSKKVQTLCFWVELTYFWHKVDKSLLDSFLALHACTMRELACAWECALKAWSTNRCVWKSCDCWWVMLTTRNPIDRGVWTDGTAFDPLRPGCFFPLSSGLGLQQMDGALGGTAGLWSSLATQLGLWGDQTLQCHQTCSWEIHEINGLFTWTIHWTSWQIVHGHVWLPEGTHEKSWNMVIACYCTNTNVDVHPQIYVDNLETMVHWVAAG